MLDTVESNVEGDINKITKVLEEFKKLDFTHKINNPIGNVSKGFNDMSDIINKMLLDYLTNGSTLEQNARQLSSNVEDLSASSNAQAASLEETAAVLEEITSTIVNNTDNISHMATYSNELSQSIKSGQKLASSTVKAMDEINSQTQAIAEAITVIDQIAFQTNILSLNAAATSEIAQIANSTSDMVKLIVDEANEANFIGKGSIKKVEIKKIDDNVQDERKTTKLSIPMPKSTKPRQSTPEKITPTAKPKPIKSVVAPKKIVSSNKSDDEWESF